MTLSLLMRKPSHRTKEPARHTHPLCLLLHHGNNFLHFVGGRHVRPAHAGKDARELEAQRAFSCVHERTLLQLR